MTCNKYTGLTGAAMTYTRILLRYSILVNHLKVHNPKGKIVDLNFLRNMYLHLHLNFR